MASIADSMLAMLSTSAALPIREEKEWEYRENVTPVHIEHVHHYFRVSFTVPVVGSVTVMS